MIVFRMHFIHLIPVIILAAYALAIVGTHPFQILGFGVGLGLGLVCIFLIGLRYRLPLIFSLFSFLLLLLVSFSHFSFYVANNEITKEHFLLPYYLGLFLFLGLLIRIILTLSAFPLGKTVFAYGHPSWYFYKVLVAVLIRGWGSFLMFSVVAPVFEPLYIPGYCDAYAFLIWSVLMWCSLPLFHLRVDNQKIKDTIQNRKLRTFDAKRQIILGYIFLIGISTLFESFRGLWWVWFGTAIWITLVLASFWKIWKHILDVPKDKMEDKPIEGS